MVQGLTLEQFNQAIAVLAQHHTTKIMLNFPRNGFVGDMGRTHYRIHIHQCCPGCTKDLHAAGFDLQMGEGGLEVIAI